MPSSQEFREALQAGKIQEAFTLALTEAVELKITTWVSSSELDADIDRDVTVKNAVSRRSLEESQPEEAKPGHRLRTSINLMQGDIENEIGDRFLNNSAYHELLRFHFTQVDKGQQIIEQNIHSLQKIFSLVTSLNNPSPDSSPGFSSEAFALTQVEEETPGSELESTTVEIPRETTVEETPLEPEFFSSDAIASDEQETPLSGDVLESLVEAEEEIQQRRSEVSFSETELNIELTGVLAEESPDVAIASPFSEEEESFDETPELTEDWLEAEAKEEQSTTDSSLESLFLAEEESTTPSTVPIATSEEEESFDEIPEPTEDWLEVEVQEEQSEVDLSQASSFEIEDEITDEITDEIAEQSTTDSSLESLFQTEEEEESTTPFTVEIAASVPIEADAPSQPQETLRSPEEIWEEEVADNQTEAFIDNLFSSDDWIEGELSEEEKQAEALPEKIPESLSNSPEQLEIEGWDRTSNLRLGEQPTPEVEDEIVEDILISSEQSESNIFQVDDLAELSESEEEFDLEGWEFSSDSAETANPTEEKEAQSSLAALEVNELANELAVDENTEANNLGKIDNPWDTPASKADLSSFDEEENEESQEEEKEEDWGDFVDEEEEEEEEDWGDFVKFVEQDIPTPPVLDNPEPTQPKNNTQQTSEINPFETSGNTDWGEWLEEDATENSEEDAIAEKNAIAVQEEWNASPEIDPFAVSQSDTESYTSIVEEDWEEFAIEELEPFPKPGLSALQTPLLEETFATASVDEILGDPPELIDDSVGDFSDSELDRNWDEELFGDEFNFDISLSDEADLPSDLLDMEAKKQPNHNT